MGTLDPSGLLAGTREVYWWAVFDTDGAPKLVGVTEDARRRGSQPSPFRARLLHAWFIASSHEHTLLRLGFPEYAGAMLMFQLGGIPNLVDFLNSLERDVVDIRSAASKAAERASLDAMRAREGFRRG